MCDYLLSWICLTCHDNCSKELDRHIAQSKQEKGTSFLAVHLVAVCLTIPALCSANGSQTFAATLDSAVPPVISPTVQYYLTNRYCTSAQHAIQSPVHP
jgi:hypothetical protein